MGIIDFILNLAGLLLWLNWCSIRFDPLTTRTPATLVGTLRRAAPRRWRRWHLLAAIGGLVILRALFYWQIGSATGWIGRLDLGVMAPGFHSNLFNQIFLFSIFSFIHTVAIFYIWLVLLSVLAGPEPIHRLVRIALGEIDDWPLWLKLILPLVATVLTWGLASWPFPWLHSKPTMSAAQRIEEALVVGLGSYVVWKFVAATLLVLHLLNTYIYFGRHPFWNYVNATAQTLLRPLQKIPLCLTKVDFAPIVEIVLIFLIAKLAERGLVLLYAQLLL